MKEQYDIIETANQDGHFRVFTQLAELTGLTQTLKNTGPYTVFAPTDDAFARMQADKFHALLKPDNRDALESLVRNHIVHGKLLSSDLKRLDETKSAEGLELRIESRSDLWINEAKVFSPDLEATNGVLHGLDTVLSPPRQAATAA